MKETKVVNEGTVKFEVVKKEDIIDLVEKFFDEVINNMLTNLLMALPSILKGLSIVKLLNKYQKLRIQLIEYLVDKFNEVCSQLFLMVTSDEEVMKDYSEMDKDAGEIIKFIRKLVPESTVKAELRDERKISQEASSATWKLYSKWQDKTMLEQ